ncbi:MAG: hypothetical protein U0230_15905 [Polyangiales bacterium]
MTDDPIDDELEALLRRERNRPDETPDRIAAIRRGAEAKIAALGLGTGGSGSDGGTGGSAGAGGGSAPLEVGPTSQVSSSLDALARNFGSSSLPAWLLRAAIFAAGATSGWVAHEAVDARRHAEPPRDEGTHGDRSTSSFSIGSQPPSSTNPEAAPSRGDLPADAQVETASPIGSVRDMPRESLRARAFDPSSTPTASPAGAVSASALAASEIDDGQALAEERRLLEAARTELVRGRAGRALLFLEEHRQRFPSGRLAEERDAFVVRSVAASGQTEQARAEADAFRARYPRSVLRPVVDRAVAPEPTMPAPSSPSPGPAAADPE